MPHLLRYFARRVVPPEESADCLSETLLVLWRGAHRLPQGEDELRAWSFGVARRVLANHRRGHGRRVALADRLRDGLRAIPQVDPADGAVSEALASLRAADRELVQLIVWDGFGVAEAGALLGLGPATARTRYGRAKERLRRMLAPTPGNPTPGSRAQYS